MSTVEPENLIEMFLEQSDPVKWAAIQIVKGGRDYKTCGEAMDVIEATIKKAIELRAGISPAWHDRPTGPVMWVCLPDGKSVHQIVTMELDEKDIKRGAPFHTPRVYGPIPTVPQTRGEEKPT